MRHSTLASALAVVWLLAITPAAHAGELVRTEDFTLETWYELEDGDGPIQLHRVRLDPKEGRVTKSSLFRPHNNEYLQTLGIQLEYTNTSDQKWDARINVRWLDEDGEVIDGFSGNETLSKKSAQKIVSMSVSTLKYGLARAKTLEIEIHYEP